MEFCGRATLHKPARSHIKVLSLRAFQMMGRKLRFYLLGFKGHSDGVRGCGVGVVWYDYDGSRVEANASRVKRADWPPCVR